MEPLALAPVSQQIWDLKYRFRRPDGPPIEASPEATFRRVAEAVAFAEPEGERTAWAERFFAAMRAFEFIPAGRILAGAGTDRSVTLFNCYVMGRIEDDMASIFENLKEAALTMQQGGGIGHDFSTLRPKGAPVAGVGAEASGPVSFMDVWDAMCRTIMSAGTRRGAMMATLRCDHPDIEAFVDAKADPARLRMFNLSVLVTDAFMDAVRNDRPFDLVFGGKTYRTVQARALWTRIMRAAYDYAEPGVIFIDRVNALNNLAYCETIHATNPCVTAGCWVQTAAGPRRVHALLGQDFSARLDGQDHACRTGGFFPTGRKAVVRIETREGYRLRLTSDHRVRRVTQGRYSETSEWCAAGQLAPGDLIRLNDHRGNPSWPGEFGFDEGFLLGMLVGDGTLKSDLAVLSVWLPQTAVNAVATARAAGARALMQVALAAARTLPHRADFTGWREIPGRGEYRLGLAALTALAERVGMRAGDKSITPAMEAASSEFCRGFLRGFFDCDGSVQGIQAKGVSVRLAQSDLARLEAVQRMLLRLGIASVIYRERRPAGTRSLPNGKGGLASYPTKANHELVIAGDNLLRYGDLIGFADAAKAARLEALLQAYRRRLNRERFTARVQAVVDDGVEEVFDVGIPGVNAFDANGFLAHNCGEQPLPPYGACLLGSINLARLVRHPFDQDADLDEQRLAALVATAVRFLDDVIDVSRYPLPEQRAEAHAKRRIGLGVTGLADALILCGTRYGSPRAVELAERWMRLIEEAAYATSIALAEEKGAFPLFDADALLAGPNMSRLPEAIRAGIAQEGLRNGLLTSIAPTGTISLFAGNVSSGVEPVFDFNYRRRVLGADGEGREIEVEDFAHRMFRARFGPDAELSPAFVTTSELAPEDHLAMQAALQLHCDSSISKTVNCPPELGFDAFASLYEKAYRLGLKGCTAYRPNPVTGAVLSRIEAALPASGDQAALPLAAPAPASRGEVVYMAEPLERDAVLPGFTYKLRWPDSDHAIYVTLNDIVQDGRRRPFEIFINSKNLEHYAWTVALTRMISAVFRRGGDVAFVVEELKAVFDPRGGQWMDGRYVPSLLAAIGDVIERHLIDIGFMRWAEPPALGAARAVAGLCPRCGRPALVHQEGCKTCLNCGYSKCA